MLAVGSLVYMSFGYLHKQHLPRFGIKAAYFFTEQNRHVGYRQDWHLIKQLAFFNESSLNYYYSVI